MKTDIALLLERYRAAVPVNVLGLARTLGLTVKMDEALEQGISGHIVCDKSGAYTVATAAGDGRTRQRFTLAHELGHFVLHRGILDRCNGTNDSRMYRTDTSGIGFNAEINEIHERQANSFAANLLMPKERVMERFAENQQPALAALAREFDVSLSAMRWRLKNLGLPVIE